MKILRVAMACFWGLTVPVSTQAGMGIPLMSREPIYAEATVTLRFTVSTTSEPEVISESPEGRRVTQTHIETRRLGNTDVLNEMKRQGLIRSVAGNSLVAVWAAWPDEDPFRGSSYRFFLRQSGTKGPALIRVPSAVLALTPQDWMNARDVRLQGGKIVSGTDQFESYSQISFMFGGYDNHGTLLGRDSGGGQFKAPVVRVPSQYLPAGGRLEVDGIGSGGVIDGNLDFGAAHFITSKEFAPGALPRKTTVGGSYGSLTGSMSFMSMDMMGFIWSRPAFVHHFCPLSAQLTLQRQVPVASGSTNRQITRILSETLATADLVRGALAVQGITDPTGWGLYLHAESDKYQGVANFDLVLGHTDGRYRTVSWDCGLTVNGSAAVARTEYQDDQMVSQTLQRQANATHSRNWALAADRSLYLLVTGKADIAERFGAIAEAEGRLEHQPGAATFSLFGTYYKGEEHGLANVSLSIGEPLAQTAIPAGWPQPQGTHWPYLGFMPIYQ